jgi:DNA (cytosine-5)-methyltransferase 1
MTIKILNLYAGIGGNRKLWSGDIEVTAIELNTEIAKIYQEFFPQDKVIVTDAHQYLLEHYKEYDFIWASPPCPTHSDIRRCGVHKVQYEAQYPDMKLYEEIILLTYFAPLNQKWVVENVKPYYEPLIKPQVAGRHCFWANFIISKDKIKEDRIHNNIIGNESVYGFDITSFDIAEKRKILRNLVNPKLGKHVFDYAFKIKQEVLKYEA